MKKHKPTTTRYQDDESRILENVYVDPVTECWDWLNGLHGGGYGFIQYKGKRWTASRASYDIFVGEIPEGMFVCHTCDNKKCCNPEHLFVGTQADNIADMYNKGRENTSGLLLGRKPGEMRGRSKLTDDGVLEIMSMLKSGDMDQAEIAEKFGVHKATISKINCGTRWRHITKGV